MPQGLSQIIAVGPFEHPDAAVALAAMRAGALGVVDVGRDAQASAAALAVLAGEPDDSLGVRIPPGAAIGADALPRSVGTVILEAGTPLAPWQSRRVLVQVTSVAEADAAAAAGAYGLIAKGNESGGRVGDETSFVLLQALVCATTLPVWVQGGIGRHSAAACIAGGAAGVVLDAQLALARESTLPRDIKAAIAAMDGSETVVVGGHRVYTRPDLPVRDLAARPHAGMSFGCRDLRTQLLPAGQDAAFARSLAERYRTVGGIVRGIASAIAHDTAAARRQLALAPHSAFAADLRIRYPILQGPMTRVSDQAAFAEAVADAGALPFLALALMRGPEVEALLAETARRLDGKAWGVGILGFVPQELRDEQLEVVRRIRPPVALIAGGRPSQARPLEDLRIATFLHAPSPGLLDLYLEQGARRFVFEGSECGGHVGPRTSFALWDLQIERLLLHAAPAELDVVFAGGIHDARSAAMVAAMAAPLVERGVRIGVLMGTAYLFTREAVACGAIEPGFQQAAVECAGTVLLETAPGHATRCADTDYVRMFRAERERLQREGVPAQRMWRQLEELNLGRLRIAAKGLKREADALVRVDADTQRREGMVMLGQVAALRADVGTLAQLHHDVAAGSAALLQALPEARASDAVARAADVAIVGMAAIMPGAPDLATFWANIVNGVNSIREVPPERWRVETFYDPKSGSGEMTPSKWGGFLDPIAFDPLQYGIPPLSLAAIEPVQLLALEVSRRALADAGYAERAFDRETTSVIFGAEAGTDLAGAYGFRGLYRQYAGPLPAELDAVLPRMTEDSFPGILANVIAGRIANRLDLGGVNYTVDAACASSLAAVDLACKELATGTSSMVICGGGDLHNGIVDFLSFASVQALSPTGQCRTFDAAADGIALGEGVAAIVVKRLADAERDGDRVYAVIKGVGGGSDGKSLGLTAPRAQGQARTLARAYAQAGVAASDVGLIEAHGTGTVVGDRTELETLNRFFGNAGARPATIALGSIKSQIGHTKCAAGLAGVIKGALSLYHRVLPPTLNITRPNPGWTRASPFVLSCAARPWPGSGRKAGVSAFGFGGTNFHAVLAEHEPSQAQTGHARWPAEMFLFRGNDAAEALERVAALERVLDAGPLPLADLARSVSRGQAPVQFAVVARDAADLRKKIGEVRASRAHANGVFVADPAPLAADAPIAFLFPGQGSQRVGMLRDLFIAFPDLQRHLDTDARWRDAMFPGTAWEPEDEQAQRATLTDTRIAQPALGVAGLALADLLQRVGVRARMFAGHSYGELVALCVAGALPRAALPALSELRGRRIHEACAARSDPGTMAAVVADAVTTSALLAGLADTVVANENAPDQSVVSGPAAQVATAMARLREAGIHAQPIAVSCAFHSPLVHPACRSFAGDLDDVAIAPLEEAVYSNTTAAPYPREPAAIRALLAEHVAKPVRFAAQIDAMYAAGARIFVEVGPGRVLTGLVAKILGTRPHAAVACDRAGEPGVTQFLFALGQLAVHGVPIDTEALYAERGAMLFDLAAPPHAEPRSSCWWVDGQRAWPMAGEPPAHAMRPVREPVAIARTLAAPSGDDVHKEAVVLEYLRSMRALAEAQRRVMLAYLGSDPGAVAAVHDVVAAQAPTALPASRAELPAPIAADRLPVPSAAVDVQALLLSIVSERTGYPVAMLDLDLDLEADLSIDSIKRVEILGTIARRLRPGTAAGQDELPEDLVAVKTLRGIVDALAPLAAAVSSAEPVVPAAATPAVAQPAVTATFPVQRYVVRHAPLARGNGAGRLGDRAIRVVGAAPGFEEALMRGPAAEGGARLARGEDDATEGEALLDLTPLRPDWKASDVPVLFRRVRDALVNGASRVLVAGTADGPEPAGVNGQRINGHLMPPSGGVSGMIKCLRKEWPDRQISVANFAPHLPSAQLAAHVLAELDAVDDASEVGYSPDGVRQSPRVVRAEHAGGEPAPRIALDGDSVVLLTGGARGITAAVAREFARRFRCRLELVGRTPLPSAPADAELARAADAGEVRRILIARGTYEGPAQIEAACARVMAEREIRDTLAAIEQAGGTATYHRLDVRDAAALGRLIDDIYARHGRLDGVIHGAGVIEDKLARDKTPESFARVFDTKVGAALAIAERVRQDIGFVVFFSSIASTFGSRGQSDYAAANDFLDRLAVKLNATLPGRVVSINWGPWDAAGMVSAELAREYARRGIELIAPEAGVASLLDELLRGPAADAQVILMRGDPSSMA